MNWKTFLGDDRYSRLQNYCRDRQLTISAVIRMAIDKFLKVR